MSLSLLVFALVACGPPTAPPPGQPPPREAPAEAQRPPMPEGGLKPLSEAPLDDPAAMLEACRDRVEGPERPQECSSDADCTTAGCSSEVCLPRAAAAQVQTTCEVLPCFMALGTCGCHEQQCTWTPKSAPAAPTQ